MIQDTAPVAYVQPAEVSGFALGLKALSDRIQRCRDIAKEMGLPPLGNFPSEYAMRAVESAYADYQDEYHEWLAATTSSVEADLDAAAVSPVVFPADHTDDQPSRDYRPELIEEPQRRRVYRDSDGNRYTEW